MMFPVRARALVILLLSLSSTAAVAADALSTVAERSGFKTTGRYDETAQLCAAFAREFPDAVRCDTFGKSPEGRAMLALVVSRSGALTPEAARDKKIPVILMQGGIHAGEIDGKDAGFAALRDLLRGKPSPNTLERVVFVFVPIFSVDGHERFGRWNRPNQRGPEEMGWRTTAQNLNLNRDYVKADAPEMQAMLRLLNTWDPIVYVDLHVTDGAKFQHDISLNVEPIHSGDAQLRKIGQSLRSALIERLTKQGSKPLAFYPSFVIGDDPMSGFEDQTPPPRFSHAYTALRNRIGVLVEAHSWRTYPERVRATRHTIVNLLELTAADGAQWTAVAAEADARAAQLGGTSVPLDYKASDKTRTIEFLGYEYSREPSAISGTLMTRYDERKPQVWTVPMKDDVQPLNSIVAPRAGYVVPAAYAARVGEHLALHGITYRTLTEPVSKTAIESFRAKNATFAATTVENRQRVTLAGAWASETRAIPAGSLFVPIAQPHARLVVAILEPMAPDSMASWGDFNASFERKEYMEPYVAEDVAREMLAKDPALAKEFNAKLAGDPAFAANPQARLDFFYQRHESWDERFNLYPVMRTDTPLQ
jgi:predicted deacylase